MRSVDRKPKVHCGWRFNHLGIWAPTSVSSFDGLGCKRLPEPPWLYDEKAVVSMWLTF